MNRIEKSNNVELNKRDKKDNIIFFVGFIVFIISSMTGIIYNFTVSSEDISAIDIWSFVHIGACFSVMIFFWYFIKNINLSIVISILFTTLIEPIEFYMQNIATNQIGNAIGDWWYNFSFESPQNRVTDILFNCIGIFIASIYISYSKKQITNNYKEL